MALAMGMGPHRLIQPVDGHSAEGAMADRQSGTHTLPPKAYVIVLFDGLNDAVP